MADLIGWKNLWKSVMDDINKRNLATDRREKAAKKLRNKIEGEDCHDLERLREKGKDWAKSLATNDAERHVVKILWDHLESEF